MLGGTNALDVPTKVSDESALKMMSREILIGAKTSLSIVERAKQQFPGRDVDQSHG
jgi:hypothetical protein